MESQLFDQFLEDSLLAEPCGSKPVDTTSDLWPNYLGLNEYNPVAYNFEDFQNLDNLESGFNLPHCSSPSVFELPSPISECSSLSLEDQFDQKTLINPWVVPTAFENNTITPTVPCNSPSENSFSAISIPSLVSSPASSDSNSSQDVEDDMGARRPTKRARKQRSEDSPAKTPCLKRQNAHNLIEKRYRNNLNTKIQSLRDCIPSLRSATKESEGAEDGMDSDAFESRNVPKCNKGIILDKAIQYITQLEKEVKSISNENARLQLKIEGASYLRLGAYC